MLKLLTCLYTLPLLRGSLADCGIDGGTTILANPNFAILDELEACTTIFGDILVDPEFVYLILEGPQEITGTIIAHDNTILKAVSLPDVKKLGGFSFVNPQIDGNVNFPEVTEIGNLEWKDIFFPYQFSTFSWSASKLIKVSSLYVESTYLSGFVPDDDPSVDWPTYGSLEQLEMADNIRIVDNKRMNEIVLPGLKTVSGGQRDGDNYLVSFAALESTGNLVVYDDSPYRGALEGKIDLPVLNHVFGDLNFTDIERVTEISVPALTNVDSGLYVLNNGGLSDLEFPELRRVNHVVIDDQHADGAFEAISFPVLEEIGDTVATTATSQTDQTGAPATTTTTAAAGTEIPKQTESSIATEDTGPSPTDENAADTSETAPVRSNASSLKLPFARIMSLFKLIRDTEVE
ncbi:hypothetical protein NPX13_g468 [Xylaria arbuscula]|uniref:Receptor L-domain domain-containing protein n=1 Tax=Xylaria arbuscula TaxID=114810 RepID=A0A9W8TRW9_9PEZI|nr:hypothetical protein NPX13_g468 [Xylaria arbuscula]